MRILNLTQHAATPEQIAAGVFDADDDMRAEIARLLTFDNPPTKAEMEYRAMELVALAEATTAHAVMIGGAPFFMSTLEEMLKTNGIDPLYAFSRRESVEETMPDGSVRKVSIFKHVGFVGV